MATEDDSARIDRLEDLVEMRLAALNGDWTAGQLKEFIESIMEEHAKAIEIAGDEREKAAAALRDQLTDRIAAGDTNLREHIAAQISQLHIMVENSERLSLARLDAMQREAKIQHEADQAAIAKAEAANETRFYAANEWRGQSADRERTQQEQISGFIATLTPLTKSDAIEDKLTAAIDRNREDIIALTNRFDVKQGESVGVKDAKEQQGVTAGYFFAGLGALATVVGLIVLFANNVLSGGG